MDRIKPFKILIGYAQRWRQLRLFQKGCATRESFCWSGTGASIVANKTKNVPAALCTDTETARLARVLTYAQVLVLSNRSLTEERAFEILEAWFSWCDTTQGKEEVKALEYLET